MPEKASLSIDDIRLGDEEFWNLPVDRREAAFATLRRKRPVSFHQEPEVPMLGKGPGFWSVTRYADILEVSRNPETFSSARGGVNIIDQPDYFSEFFGSMIVMDDPRHARMRRIVSRGFTPRMLDSFKADVEVIAAEIVEKIAGKGSCDFVTEVAALVPLRIIIDLMGIPRSEERYIFDRTNVIVGDMDPEYVPDQTGRGRGSGP